MDKGEDTYPDFSMMQWIQDGCRLQPDKSLFVTATDSYSYSEVYDMVNSLAFFLEEDLGLEGHSYIVLSAPNVVQIPVLLAAAQLLDLRVVLLSTTTGEREYKRALELVKPKLVISSESAHREAAQIIAPSAKIMTLADDVEGMPSIEEAIASCAGEAPSAFNANAAAHIIVFTSGSTGDPKAVVNRASSFALNGIALSKWLDITSSDTVYLPVPLIHVFGLVGTYATLAARATLATAPKFNAEEACGIIDSRNVSVHLGVPTNFVRELKCNSDGKWDFSSLRTGLVAGADCPPAVLEEFERLYGCRIMQSYGMSETAATLTVTPLELPVEERIRTTGFCIDGASIKTDPDTGEILCKTASLMEGILQPDGSVDLPLDDGWFRTGDVGKIDDRDMLSVTGRLKDVIVRGGINIYPSEIEVLYEDHEGVSECRVLPMDDEGLGQRTVLVVATSPDSSIGPDELREYAKGKIDKCKVPDFVVTMNSLPYLNNGKVDKVALEKMVRRKVGSQS